VPPCSPESLGYPNLHIRRLKDRGLLRSRDRQGGIALQDVVNHRVTPDGELHIQPAGEEDSELRVAPGAAVDTAFGLTNIRNPGYFSERDNVVSRFLIRPKVSQLLPIRLSRLGHIEIAVLTEHKGRAIEFAGD